jgi:hypothetical protein
MNFSLRTEISASVVHADLVHLQENVFDKSFNGYFAIHMRSRGGNNTPVQTEEMG